MRSPRVPGGETGRHTRLASPCSVLTLESMLMPSFHIQQNCFGLALPPLQYHRHKVLHLVAATRKRSSALKTLILGTSSSLRPPFGSGPPFPINSLGRHRDNASRSSISRVLYHCEVAEGPRCPRTLQLISRSPMRLWSVGLALPPGSVSSLRRHGSFDLPHGALRCSQSRQFLPSLGLDDQRPHLRPVVAPRPLYMSSNSRPRAHPRCRCKSEARRPHGKRGRGR